MDKSAQTDYPIHDFLKNRWSPRAFSNQLVGTEEILSLFEAARWSPSGGNSQPWSFIVTTHENPVAFNQLVDTLKDHNQIWAKNAPVLVLTIVRRENEPGKPNPWAIYDLGQSVAHLSVQASAIGLTVHQMAGFDRSKASAVFQIPEGYDPITVIAIGYPGDPEKLPDQMRERELASRTRKPLSEMVFDSTWQEPFKVK